MNLSEKPTGSVLELSTPGPSFLLRWCVCVEWAMKWPARYSYTRKSPLRAPWAWVRGGHPPQRPHPGSDSRSSGAGLQSWKGNVDGRGTREPLRVFAWSSQPALQTVSERLLPVQRAPASLGESEACNVRLLFSRSWPVTATPRCATFVISPRIPLYVRCIVLPAKHFSIPLNW